VPLLLLLVQEPLSGYEASRQSCIAATRAHLGGLLRSKGIIWVATLPGDMVEWSSAGVLLHLQRAQPWFCSIDKVRQGPVLLVVVLVGGCCLHPRSHVWLLRHTQ
jgi:G3E family GTPase